MKNEVPTVTVIIPCLNEELNIEGCLRSVLASKHFSDGNPGDQILVMDGDSRDKTRDIVACIAAEDIRVRLLDNPGGNKARALNTGIAESEGDIVIRMDAHAQYPVDYVDKLLVGILSHKADNIGGIRHTVVNRDDNSFAIATAEAISHPYVVGNALYRTGGIEKPRYVDTVFCGCYRREVFDRIGYFNESLIRTQDREFNARLVADGGKILLDPRIHCSYVPRTDFKSYCRWTWNGAFWTTYARRFTETAMLGWRNLIPTLFVIYLFVGTLGSISLLVVGLSGLAWLPGFPLLFYGVLALKAGFTLARKHGRIGVLFWFPIIMFVTHVLYGIAATWGFLNAKCKTG